jgi:hypothetical protein
MWLPVFDVNDRGNSVTVRQPDSSLKTADNIARRGVQSNDYSTHTRSTDESLENNSIQVVSLPGPLKFFFV